MAADDQIECSPISSHVNPNVLDWCGGRVRINDRRWRSAKGEERHASLPVCSSR